VLSGTTSPDEALLNRNRQATQSLQSYINALGLEYDQLLADELSRAKTARARLFVQCFGGAFTVLLGELLAAIVFVGAVAGQVQTLKVNSRRLAAGLPLEPLFTDNWELNQIGHDLVEASVALSQRERDLQSRRVQVPESAQVDRRIENEQHESAAGQLRERNQQLAASLSSARESLAAKAHFLADLSRELRIPLSSLLGFSELLYDGKLGPVTEQQKGCLSDILAGSKRLLQLADNVVGAARPDSLPADPSPDVIELEALMKEVKHSLVPVARKKGVKLEIGIDPGLREIRADLVSLKQSLYEHIANAVQFTPHDALLEVHMRPERGNAIRLEVHTTGLGLPSKDVVRLFPAFHVETPSLASQTELHGTAHEERDTFYAIVTGIARPAEPAVRVRHAGASTAPKSASTLIHG
jgi:signal transduction histidine kinase